VVALTSAPTQRRSGRAGVELADYATRRAELSVTEPLSAGFLRVDGSAFATNGFYNLAAGTRGAVDRPLASDHQLAQVSWNQALTSDTQATVMGRIFSEHRNNGTALQQNDADTKFVSAALSGAPRADFSWNSVAYVQQQSFSSFFSSVSADRMTETPANNQFDVPASAAGASYTATWREDQSSTTAGTDLRWVKGETREQFLYQTGRFTRGRFAGGAQGFAGAFVHHRRDWAQQWSASIDLRLDYWKNYDGHTREYDLTSGASTLNASYHDQSGWQFSPRLGVVWQPDSAVRVRSAVYRAFRLPTLNEYYRPFRVGNVNTLANAALTPETLDGAEMGIDFTANTLKLSVTAFANQFEHAVGNITLSSTPAAVTRQRQNIDEVRIRGLELSAQWTPIQSVELRAGYILDDAHVGVAHAQPTLVGHRLAEVPRQTMTGSVQWTAPTGTRASVAARYVSAQFDDDENLLTLAPATTVDVRLEHRFGRYLETFAALENALDAKVQTSRSTAGLFTYNTPRMARGGVRIAW
jgi:outer membrane receptor protein involved in Fe transport